MTANDPDPAELLATARELVSRADPVTAGRWSRIAAHLTRQALEALIDQYWQAKGVPEASRVSRHAQLICLPSYLGQGETAGLVANTWAELSRACHEHAYELAPTAAEIEHSLNGVDCVRARICEDPAQSPEPTRPNET